MAQTCQALTSPKGLAWWIETGKSQRNTTMHTNSVKIEEKLLLKLGTKVEYLVFDATGEYIYELSNLLKSILSVMGKSKEINQLGK